MTIKEKLDRLKILKRELGKIASVVLMDTATEYLDIQRNQMNSGMNSKGERFAYRSRSYAEMKLEMNSKAGGAVDWKLEGDFQRELTLRVVSQKKYLVYSQDWKNEKLTKKYGDDIFLLTPENLEQYRRDSFMPELKKTSWEVING